MSRAPFQVLVLPFRHGERNEFEYAIFKRSDGNYWQFIAGGGEGSETPTNAAKREALEEAEIPSISRYISLDSKSTIPVVGVTGDFTWGEDVFVIPEYTFGVEVDYDSTLHLSKEHADCKWVAYEKAVTVLKWDSNKNALWELNARLAQQI